MADTKLIIDTDPGIDDAMAIHYACAHMGLNLLALTSIFGNVFTAQATRNALYLKQQTAYGFDVAEGAATPLKMPANKPSHYVHGDEGLGDLKAPENMPPADSMDAVHYIKDMCERNPGEVVLCPVGPLTNIAKLVQEYPHIIPLVKRVVIMGGAVWAQGNVTPYAEANIWNDPHAAELVFAADWEIDLIGLDVTQKITCTQADFDSLAKKSPKIGKFLADIARFYIRFYNSVLGKEVCVMHDPSAIIAITDRNLFEFKSAPLSVITQGEEIGNTIVSADPGRRSVNVAIDADIDAIRKRFLDICGQADTMVEARLEAQMEAE